MEIKKRRQKTSAAGRPSVVVIGGSLTGLMHAIMLHSIGHKVHVIEQSSSSSRNDHAAGITAHPQVVEFFRHYGFSEQWSIPCPGVQFLDAKAYVRRFVKKPLEMTSWGVLHDHLKRRFDSLGEKDDERSQTNLSTPEFTLATRATNVSYEDGKIVIECEDLAQQKRRDFRADLVIAADGAGSNIRRCLIPDTRRKYSGYIAWRGTVAEGLVSARTRGIFSDRLTYFSMPRSYILCYLIPGETGSLDPGQRRLNWVWYHNYVDGSPELVDILKDCNDHQHRNTVPAGSVRADVWARQQSEATKVMNLPFLELITKTVKPIVSVVTDVDPVRASFFDHKVLLVGEALALIRPHLALSVNQSAMNCLRLEKALTGVSTMTKWERAVLQNAVKHQAMTNAVGTFFQSDVWAFARTLFWLLWVLLTQPITNILSF